ncbi:tRNA(m(1)G37)methyltransferase [Cryptotrichosporon argae]
MSTSSSTGPAREPAPARRVVLPPRRPDMRVLDKTAFDVELDVLAARVRAGRISAVRSSPVMWGHVLAIDRVKAIVADPDSAWRRLFLNAASVDELPDAVRAFLAGEGAEYVRDHIKLGWEHWTAPQILDAVLPFAGEGDTPTSYSQAGHLAHMNLRDEWLPYKHIIGEVILDKASGGLRTVVNKLNSIHAEYRYFDMEVIAGEPDFVATVSENGCQFTFDFSRVYWNSRLSFEHERVLALLRPGEAVADVMAGVGPFAVPAARKGCYVWGNDLNPESAKWMRANRVANKVETHLRVSEIDGRAFIRTVALDAWRTPFERADPPGSARQREKAARRASEKAARRAREAARVGAAAPVSTGAGATTDPTSTTGSEPSAPAPGAAAPLAAPPHAAPPSASTAATPAASSSAAPSTSPISAPASAPATASAPAPSPAPQTIAHYIMNLPDTALLFLDAFRGALTPLLSEPGYDPAQAALPMVHVHCFTRQLEFPAAQDDICARATASLGHAITPAAPGYHLHAVRSVAPNKHMYCLSFRLPAAVAYAGADAEAARAA